MKLYLSSYEYEIFENPREITQIKKVYIDKKSVLIVEINEPILGQKFGLGGTLIHTLYLVNRFKDSSFDNFNKFPIDVHVFIPITNEIIIPTTFIDMQNIAWACIYNNKLDAMNHNI